MIEFILTTFFLVSRPASGIPDGGPRNAVSSQDMKYPVNVQSERLEIIEKKQEAIWSGHVRAKRDTTDLTCDRLIAHYTKEQEVTRIECLGNVVVVDGDKWAKGERADFDNLTGILEVTGSPEAKQGKNHVKGTKVIFYKEKDLVTVENATTVFETNSEGGLQKSGASKSTKPEQKKKEEGR